MTEGTSADSGSDSGLVISSKTVRNQPSRKFVSQEDINRAASHLPSSPVDNHSRLAQFFVSVSPASIRVSKYDPKRAGQQTKNWQPRQPVVKWSDKSRSKMVERLATLDYSPFDIPNSLLAFITLTYPAGWMDVVPNAGSAKKHLHSLRKRFERKFDRPFYAVWKMEFQRRGAPHFHLLAPVPSGMGFSEWLSNAWADIVKHPDPDQRAKHLVAGTGVDRAKGMNSDTAQRISYYFSKHSSANKGVKEYQNTPPKEWVEAGSVGRFWGYWGLVPAVRTVAVSEEDALFIARCLRRWQRSQSRVMRVRVWRTNQRTGEVRQRWARRRIFRKRGATGFSLVTRGDLLTEKLGQYLSEH